MATPKATITKVEQITYFTTNLRNVINSQTLWYTGSPSLPSPITGFTDVYATAPLISGPTIADLTDAKIKATTLTALFQFWAKKYTAVRKHNFIRTGNTPGETNVTRIQSFAEGPNTLQPANYAAIDATAAEAGVVTDEIISAAQFNDFVTRLYNKWNIYKENTLVTSVNYCHSSCHSSCHSAGRNRR